jgi:hypothetical protein
MPVVGSHRSAEGMASTFGALGATASLAWLDESVSCAIKLVQRFRQTGSMLSKTDLGDLRAI